jgi:hypothetical protein
MSTSRRCAVKAVSGVAGAPRSQAVKSPINAGASADEGKLWRPASVQCVVASVGVAAGNVGGGALHDQTVQYAHVLLSEWRCLPCQVVDVADGLVMVDRLQVVLERLATDRDPLRDDQRRLGGIERVPLDRVRGVGQFQIVDVLKVAEGVGDWARNRSSSAFFTAICCGRSFIPYAYRRL